MSAVRPKGVAISVSGLFLSTLIFVSAAPQGFQNIGWKYYFVLMFPAFVGSLTEFFFWPVSIPSPSVAHGTSD
jgi:hypothetical protein